MLDLVGFSSGFVIFCGELGFIYLFMFYESIWGEKTETSENNGSLEVSCSSSGPFWWPSLEIVGFFFLRWFLGWVGAFGLGFVLSLKKMYFFFFKFCGFFWVLYSSCIEIWEWISAFLGCETISLWIYLSYFVGICGFCFAFVFSVLDLVPYCLISVPGFLVGFAVWMGFRFPRLQFSFGFLFAWICWTFEFHFPMLLKKKLSFSDLNIWVFLQFFFTKKTWFFSLTFKLEIS